MKIRFGTLPASELSDKVLVENPAYGNRIGKWGSRPVKPEGSMFTKEEMRRGFYTKLEASILEEGFRNPIFCNAIKEGTFSRVGTSRLWIAKKHGLDIPCIIADYVNRYPDFEELKTEEEIRSKFKDQPNKVELNIETKVGHVWISGLPHYHLNETEEEYRERNDHN
jgi:hypothetical protein